MARLIERLKSDQAADGSWGYPFETGISTDAYLIILLRTLQMDDEKLIQALTERIMSKQEANGAWKLFHDEDDGNLSATVEAYYALLYSGYIKKEDSRLLAAKSFIFSKGGIEQTHLLTKVMLAVTGQTSWPSTISIPIEIMLLPPHFPVNFYDLSVFGRANLAPLMIIATNKFALKTYHTPDLSDLITPASDDLFHSLTLQQLFIAIEQDVKQVFGLSEAIKASAIQRAKQYMLDHIEPDGTLYSYFSSTFLMIFALRSLGHPNNDPIIVKAVQGLKAMKTTINGHLHMQYTTATVWNTSLISDALQKAGVPSTDPVINRANHYLQIHQQSKYGDWAIHNPGVAPGGWGFSDVNTFNPDIDDSTASLRSISKLVRTDKTYYEAWNRGVRWVLSMQNSDGGWPAFEKNVGNPLFELLPIEGNKFLVTDSSSADLTGRTLQFFGNYTNLAKKHPVMKRGVEWLLQAQEENGSWYGRWGICYIYGTWAAITGLIAAGENPKSPAIQKAVDWFLTIQNRDGGWGESCKSDLAARYIPLGASNVTQTAWALDALIAASEHPTPEIEAGMSYLLESHDNNDWTKSYPVGQGMGGAFYIHYHSYQYIFPLLACAHYTNKFTSKAL
ncbi:squalene--hopene cyclase [Sporosarcina sp. HYO08]|nr:squalene--hopene cyclase [Sporosarcina sp. HYO08]